MVVGFAADVAEQVLRRAEDGATNGAGRDGAHHRITEIAELLEAARPVNGQCGVRNDFAEEVQSMRYRRVATERR